MKMKDVGFFARHYEKIIVAATCVVLLLTAAKYLVGSPHEITLGNETRSPGSVDDYILEKHAKPLHDAITSDGLPQELINLQNWDLTDQFKKQNAQPAFPTDSFKVSLGLPFNDDPPEPPEDAVEEYYVPKVPKPNVVFLQQNLNTINRALINGANQEEWRKIFPTKGAPDLSSVSIFASFPLDKMVAELQNSGDVKKGILRLPSEWWEGGAWGIMDVQVERQVRAPDGTWGATEALPPLPDQAFDTRQVPDIVPPKNGPGIVKVMQEQRQTIIRQPFPEATPSWVRSDPNSGVVPADGADAAQPDAKKEEKKEEKDFGIKDPKDGDAEAEPGESLANILGAMGYGGKTKIDLYTHDLRVSPGKAYRYRVRVRVLNPLFSKLTLNKDQRKGIGKKFLMSSNWSDWSKSVEIKGLKSFHFAKAAGALQPVEVTVMRFTLGQDLKETFKIRPGDAIGSKVVKTLIIDGKNVDVNIDFNTGATLIDLNSSFRVVKKGRRASTTLLVYMQNNELKARRLDTDQAALEAKFGKPEAPAAAAAAAAR